MIWTFLWRSRWLGWLCRKLCLILTCTACLVCVIIRLVSFHIDVIPCLLRSFSRADSGRVILLNLRNFGFVSVGVVNNLFNLIRKHGHSFIFACWSHGWEIYIIRIQHHRFASVGLMVLFSKAVYMPGTEHLIFRLRDLEPRVTKDFLWR